MTEQTYDTGLEETVPLSDLVLLQMMGEIDTYTDELLDTGDGDHVIHHAESMAAVDEVFDEIVRKTVEAQFEDKYTFVRELAQNAKDAYPTGASDRPVEFSLDHEPGETVLTARDHGGGMAPDELIQELLIPYRSGKHLDPETIGEHGIGWYSVLDPADEVTVTTGNDGVTTTATLRETDAGWVADIATEPGRFDGTAIQVSTDYGNFDADAIWDELRQHVGHVDPATATITLDGDAVNTLPDEYTFGASKAVDVKHGYGTLDLYYRQNDTYDMDFPLTQDGLYVTRANTLHMLNGSDGDDRILRRIFQNLTENGYEFWIDIPETAGLTKGRNEIVAGDRDKIYDAIGPVFEDFVIERLLEDDGYVKEVDTKATDWVNDLLEAEYMEQRLWKDLAANPVEAAKGGAVLGAALMATPFIAAYTLATDEMVREGVKDTITSPLDAFKDPAAYLAEFRKDLKKQQYYSEFSGFSQRVMDKDCIDAVRVNQDAISTQASIRDMIDAYIEGDLYPMAGDTYPKEGLYVDPDNRIARQVLDRFDEMDMVIGQHPGFAPKESSGPSWEELKAKIRDDLNSLRNLPSYLKSATDEGVDVKAIGKEIWETGKYAAAALPKPTDRYRINHIGYHSLHDIMTEEDAAHEYHDLLLTASYVDTLVSQANDLDPQPTMLYMTNEGFGELAHTDGISMGLNLASGHARTLVQQLQNGELAEPTFNGLVHSIIHEKAHGVHGNDHATADHGQEFYDTLRELEEGYTQYTTANGIDPMDDVNAYLDEHGRADTRDTSIEEFADLTSDYRSILPF